MIIVQQERYIHDRRMRNRGIFAHLQEDRMEDMPANSHYIYITGGNRTDSVMLISKVKRSLIGYREKIKLKS